MSGLRRGFRLILLAARAELRSPGLWLPALLAALAVGAFTVSSQDAGATIAVVLATRLGQAYGIAACLWFGYRAVRDQDERLGAVLRSKPVDGAAWVTVSWATGVAVWTLILGLAFLAAALAMAFTTGVPASLVALLGFGHAWVTVVIASALSFGLSRVMRSPLGGILIMLAWVCVIAGLQNAPPYMRLEYAQNRGLFLPVSAGILAFAALLVERLRRQELRRPLVPVLSALLFLPLSWAGGQIAARDAAIITDPSGTVWEAIGRQHLEPGRRLPGFWLPDGHGGTVRTADHTGKVLLVYLFAAGDLETARNLKTLSELGRELGAQGVQPLGVCLSPDHADAAMLARAGYGFPIGADQTAAATGDKPQSTLLTAYNADLLPLLVITDRRRMVREVLTDTIHDPARLRELVTARLTEEPR